MIVRRDGFAVIERAVTLPIKEPLEFTIEPSPVATYVQTVSKTEEPVLRTPFLVSIVAREEIEKTGANSLEDALRSVPGLQHGTQGNAYTRVSTRGLRDTADVLTVVDGVPMRQLNGSTDLTMLPVLNVQEVEFAKGPGSSVYGRSAIGGVMQFFHRSAGPQPFHRGSGIRLGQFWRPRDYG
ncbi:MAG: Plug domain-containing protein [Bryobacterales bacterium]|nr:Plug domain-containing protein [Bryobacterales bacterium]